VRLCAGLVLGYIVIVHFGEMFIRSRLGWIERIKLNIASLLKGVLKYKPIVTLILQLILFMVKIVLSEVKFRDVSTKRLYHLIGNRVGQHYNERNVSLLYTKCLDWTEIYRNKETKSQPKESIETNIGTGGWPKGSNFNGHRVKVVPGMTAMLSLNAFYNRNGRREGVVSGGRLTGLFATSIARYSSGSNDKIPKQLVDLTQWCSLNPDKRVDRKIYKLF
jgi:hypothetical protein